jgi:hypothetical protein
VATSNARRALAYLESRKNLTGCLCGLAGVAAALTGLAGAYWPVVVAGLYGAGALIAPPERPDRPAFIGPEDQISALRDDFAALRDYLASSGLPPEATAELNTLLDALLNAPEPVTDPEALHILTRAVRQDVPETVDAYLRTRWWSRLSPGTEPPERHLERQLALITGELTGIAATAREEQELRQRIQERYLQDRNPRPPEVG